MPFKRFGFSIGNLLRMGTHWQFAILMLLLPALASCKSCDSPNQKGDTGVGNIGDGSYTCDASKLANTIPASEWVRSNTKIHLYRYEADIGGDVINLTLLSKEQEKLGKLTIRDFFGATPDARATTSATWERENGMKLDLSSEAIITGEKKFTTRTTIESSSNKVRVHAEFGTLDCYANSEPPEGSAHACAWPAPVVRPEFTVPSCGFDIAPRLPSAPNLVNLEYRTPVESDPGTGGMLRDGGMEATLRVMHRGESLKNKRIAKWLDASAAGEIIGTVDEERLSAAYSDPAWMEHIENHASSCAAQMRENQQSLGASGFQCEQELRRESRGSRTKRQGAGCGENGADCNGDPHLKTADGTSYDFQGAGEFVLMTNKVGEPLMLQARFEPIDSCRDMVEACQNVTVTTAAATKVGDIRVGVYADRDPHFVIDGKAVERIADADLSALPEDASIHQVAEDEIRVEWPDGSNASVSILDSSLDIHGEFPETRAGQLYGLWGFYNDIPSDDFVTRTGRELGDPIDQETLYEEFGASWRVGADESLFDYESGKDTSSYTMEDFPKSKATIDDLPENLIEKAKKECGDVKEQPDKNWCILDVTCMCDEELSESTEEMEPTEQTTDPDPDDPLSARGDVCLDEPDSLAYAEAPAPQCPPGDKPCIHLIREKADVELTSDLTVDLAKPGTYSAESDLESSTISSGTKVNSYLLHLNEVPEGTGPLEGAAVFPNDIVGVIVTKKSLDTSDPTLGNSANRYPSDRSKRGVDWDQHDEILVGEDRRRVEVHVGSNQGVDEIRIVSKSARSN